MPYNFRYQPDILTTMEPWRDRLGDEFESVVARLSDRDRQIEDYLSKEVAQGILAYNRITQPVTGIGTSATEIPGLTTTVRVPGGRAIKITASCVLICEAGGDSGQLLIAEDGTNLVAPLFDVDGTGHTNTFSPAAVAFRTPAAGEYEYTVLAQFLSGTTNQAFANGTNPGYIVIEDIGPSSVLD